MMKVWVTRTGASEDRLLFEECLGCTHRLASLKLVYFGIVNRVRRYIPQAVNLLRRPGTWESAN